MGCFNKCWKVHLKTFKKKWNLCSWYIDLLHQIRIYVLKENKFYLSLIITDLGFLINPVVFFFIFALGKIPANLRRFVLGPCEGACSPWRMGLLSCEVPRPRSLPSAWWRGTAVVFPSWVIREAAAWAGRETLGVGESWYEPTCEFLLVKWKNKTNMFGPCIFKAGTKHSQKCLEHLANIYIYIYTDLFRYKYLILDVLMWFCVGKHVIFTTRIHINQNQTQQKSQSIILMRCEEFKPLQTQNGNGWQWLPICMNDDPISCHIFQIDKRWSQAQRHARGTKSTSLFWRLSSFTI